MGAGIFRLPGSQVVSIIGMMLERETNLSELARGLFQVISGLPDLSGHDFESPDLRPPKISHKFSVEWYSNGIVQIRVGLELAEHLLQPERLQGLPSTSGPAGPFHHDTRHYLCDSPPLLWHHDLQRAADIFR